MTCECRCRAWGLLRCVLCALLARAGFTVVLQCVRMRHGDDIVARIDKMDVTGDPGRKIGQQIECRAADFLKRNAATKGRMALLKRKQLPRIANPSAGKSTDRSGRYRIDANSRRTEIHCKIPH